MNNTPINMRKFVSRQYFSQQLGFSMVEVLIAVLVLSLGLLGYASLLALSLRGNQSANHRTIATNLAYEMFDIMRANRNNAIQYTMDYGDFTGINDVASSCADKSTAIMIADCVHWMGSVQQYLPNGKAQVRVTSGAGAQTVATISIQWADQRSNVGSDENAENQIGTFTYASRL